MWLHYRPDNLLDDDPCDECDSPAAFFNISLVARKCADHTPADVLVELAPAAIADYISSIRFHLA